MNLYQQQNRTLGSEISESSSSATPTSITKITSDNYFLYAVYGKG
jgi:hypothetical protein